MKYLLTTILFFVSFISFSQDINFGEGEFEVKTTIDAVYTEDGDTWYHAKVEHDGIWEIYTDTAVGPFIDLKLQENGFNFSHVDFSEQGMQENGLADLDLVA